MENSLEFRISNLGSRALSTCEALPFAILDGSDVVIRCPRESGQNPNEKLVWLWNMLKHERRKLKTLQADGATLSCIFGVTRGPVVLQPNATEFLHLVGATLVITATAA